MGSHSENGDYSYFGRQESMLIDKTFEAHQLDTGYEEIKGITKKHWLSSDTRTKCFRKKCRKKFTFLERPHHCRRCGEVFCLACVQFKRKLNKLANPDPDGKEYRVCQECFDQGPQEIGCTRNRLNDFYDAKKSSQATGKARTMGQRRRGWRSRFDLDKECARLIEGFRLELKRSDIGKALVDMKTMLVVPDWQKGSSWLQEDLNTTCQSCKTPFNLLLNKKRHCRVCAMAVCGNCSTKKLILYVPDFDTASEMSSQTSARFSLSEELDEPKLSVIEIVGCPDKEPEVCLYLRVCEACRTSLTEIQVHEHQTSLMPIEDDFLSKLKTVWEEFFQIREKIENHLEQYCSTIDSLENNSTGNSSRGVRSQDNMKILAKAQTDLSDFFTAYIMKVQQLKKLRQSPTTQAQAKLLQNFIKSKCEYYMDNMYAFRCMRNKMAEFSPPETLDMIQKIVDKDAIVSSHLYIKQLVFEVIYWTEKHKILQDLPTTLITVEEKVEADTEACLKVQRENWDEHQTLVQDLLQLQLKSHKLIRPSRQLTKKFGSSHVCDITKQRSLEVIENIRLQLQLKAAHNSFQTSLQALQQCRSNIQEM